MSCRTPPRWLVAVAVAAMGTFPLLGLPAHANETVNANHIVVLSNDISNTTTDVVPGSGSVPRASSSSPVAASGSSGSSSGPTAVASAGGSGSGNDNNRSGFGDGTNPGQGGSHNHSSNQGTDNPNNAHH